MSPGSRQRYTLERVARGLDTISVTGNIQRLPDRPVPDHGTGHLGKMLSIVPLMNGGGMLKPAPAARHRSTCSS